MISRFWIALILLCSVPKANVLNITQTDRVLDVSVIVHNKVYIIDPETNETKKGMVGCSGTFIAPGTVITAAHCFTEPSLGMWVKDDKNHTFEVKLLKISPPHDLALLGVISKAPHTYAHLANKVRVGEKVINVGSPLGLGLLLSEGIVSSLDFHIKQFKSGYMITDAMINSGSSGGGAFNAEGELIGVNTMTVGSMFGWAGISLAVDLPTIKQFMGAK